MDFKPVLETISGLIKNPLVGLFSGAAWLAYAPYDIHWIGFILMAVGGAYSVKPVYAFFGGRRAKKALEALFQRLSVPEYQAMQLMCTAGLYDIPVGPLNAGQSAQLEVFYKLVGFGLLRVRLENPIYGGPQNRFTMPTDIHFSFLDFHTARQREHRLASNP